MKHILIVVLISVLIGCGGADERKAAYMQKARESYESGDYEKARIDAKNAIQIDPNYAEAVFLLSDIHEQKQQYKKAFRGYMRAAGLAPENVEYQAKVGTYYLLAGEYDKVRETIEKINAIKPSSTEVGVLTVGLLMRESNLDQAEQMALRLVDEHPDDIEPMKALVQLYKGQKRLDDALDVLARAAKLDPEDISIKKEMVNIYLHTENYSQAEKVIKEVIAQEPDDYKSYLLLASLYKKMDQPSVGEQVLRDAVAVDDSLKKKLTLVSYIDETRGHEAAEKELQAMISSSDTEEANELKLALARLYHNTDREADELKIYNEIIESDKEETSTGMNARINISKHYIADKKIDEALEIINNALEISPNETEILLLRAAIALMREDAESAIIDLRLVIKENPESIQAYKLLIDAHLKNNDKDQVRETLNIAYDNSKYNASALKELMELNNRLNNMEGVEQTADAILRIEPDNPQALFAKIKVLNTKKDYTEAAELGQHLIKMVPDDPQAYLMLVPSMMGVGKLDELHDIIETGYARTENDIRLLQIIIALNTAQKKTDASKTILEDELKARGEDAEIYRLMGKVDFASGDLDSAIANYKKAIDIKNDVVDYHVELASVYTKKKDLNAAIKTLEAGKSVLPGSRNIRMTLALLYQVNGQPEVAIAEYEDVLKTDTDNTIAINNLAALLVEGETTESNIARAVELVKSLEASTKPAILDTVGWVYYKAGQYDKSVELLDKVILQSSDTPIFNYHLGMAYMKTGDKAKAKQYLEKSVETGAVFTGRDEAEQTLKEL